MASTKKTPAKPVATKKTAAKKAAPQTATAKKIAPTKPKVRAKPQTAAKPKKVTAPKAPVDYRLNSIRELASAFEDKETRDLIEHACLDLSSQAHALFVARTDDGIAYRNYLRAVSEMAKEVATSAARGYEEEIDSSVASISDELDNSPFLRVAHQYHDADGRLEVYRALQEHLRLEEVDMAFMLR